MDNSTAKISIDHLIKLGFSVNVITNRWRDIYKKNPIGNCKGCGFKIRITDPISKGLRLKYYSKRHIPEVHWIFDFKLNPNTAEAVEQCSQYIKTLTNTQKKQHIYPCCYNCWNIAVYHTEDYNTESVNMFYAAYKENNPEYVNWNEFNFEQIQNEEQRKAKIMFNYDYISKWCETVGICYNTEDGLKYCSKRVGHCVHTNAELAEAEKAKIAKIGMQMSSDSETSMDATMEQ